jgi:hypothetical protein
LLTQRSKDYFHPVSHQIINFKPGPLQWQAAINWTTNLTELRVTLDFNNPKLMRAMSNKSPFIDGTLFPSLNKLAFRHVVSGVDNSPQGAEVARLLSEKFLAAMNKRMVGVTAVLESVLEGVERECPQATFVFVDDVWAWHAPPKKTFARLAWEGTKCQSWDLTGLIGATHSLNGDCVDDLGRGLGGWNGTTLGL